MRMVRCQLLLTVFILCAFVGIRPTKAQGVDTVTYSCDGSGTGPVCDVFQLDGSTGTANADTCVGTENGCSNEQNPKWPADWDALFFPALAGQGAAGVPVISGAPPGAYSFSTPWNGFGSFSGVIKSTLVTTGTSTILKQGSKASGDINTWVVAAQNSPPKDAYVAGVIASYIAPPGASGGVNAGDELLYLASTRFAPQGSATIGIWFFQENVTICASGSSFCSGNTTTPAVHKNGDLFLFLAFSGSGTATIVPAIWQNGSLNQGPNLPTCPGSGDTACAVTNNVTSIKLGASGGPELPGTAFNVSGSGFAGFPGGVVPVNQFQEIGVDFNAIFGGVAPCFSSVMFASVSSGSSPATASMKSILLGSFNTCAISATKNCAAGTANVAAGTITYPINGQVENIGGGQTSNLTLTDTFNNVAQPFDNGVACTCSAAGCTVSGTDCSTVKLNPGSTVNYAATITTTNNGGSDVISAVMGGAGGGSASATSNTALCQSINFPDSVTISKVCSPGAQLIASGGVIEVQVSVDGTVTNTDQGNLPLTNVNVYNCVGASFGAPTGNATADIATCKTNGGTLRGPFALGTIQAGSSLPWSDVYLPSILPAGAPFNFNDQVLVTASCASKFCQNATVDSVSNPVSCPLCPGP